MSVSLLLGRRGCFPSTFDPRHVVPAALSRVRDASRLAVQQSPLKIPHYAAASMFTIFHLDFPTRLQLEPGTPLSSRLASTFLLFFRTYTIYLVSSTLSIRRMACEYKKWAGVEGIDRASGEDLVSKQPREDDDGSFLFRDPGKGSHWCLRSPIYERGILHGTTKRRYMPGRRSQEASLWRPVVETTATGFIFLGT